MFLNSSPIRLPNTLRLKMPEITLCLITKGRENYLSALLQSLDEVLVHSYVKVLLILNGVPSELLREYLTWAERYQDQVAIHIFETNDPRLSRSWSVIQSVESEWISFPSDDDIINSEFFHNWPEFTQRHRAYDVVACNVNLIDSQGSDLGIIRSPSFIPSQSKVEQAARAFNECPFLWPGLVVRTSSLPKTASTSRYVADWSLGLHFVFSNKISIERNSIINYRVHDLQESAVATMTRKNLEALVHFTDFTEGPVFSQWILNSSIRELSDFLQYLHIYPPIYGDPLFSSEFVSVLTGRISKLRNEEELQKMAFFTNAYAHEVLIDTTQFKYLMLNDLLDYPSSPQFNFDIQVSSDVCLQIKSLNFVKALNTSTEYEIKLFCKHSNSGKNGIYLNCLQSEQDIYDEISSKGSKHLEDTQIFRFSISPFEMRIIKRFRVLKRLSPGKINSLARKLFQER